MRASIFRELPIILFKQPEILVSKRDYIFVMSHMRSYSSLLCHILGSHDEISGYSEMHQSYYWLYDLIKLRYRVYLANNNRLEGRFVLDKMLNNRNRISESILNKNNVKMIFILRNPEDTMKSIINMGNNLVDGIEWYKDPKRVLDYYIERLKRIEMYSIKKNKSALFIDSEKIIDNTNLVLEFLTDKLELRKKLKERYQDFKYTGLPKHGDPSDTIKEFRINRQKKNYSNIFIHQEILKQAHEVYEVCRSVLLKNCISLESS